MTSRSESKNVRADSSGFGGFVGTGFPGVTESSVNS